jgi:hypothetical protein
MIAIYFLMGCEAINDSRFGCARVCQRAFGTNSVNCGVINAAPDECRANLSAALSG